MTQCPENLTKTFMVFTNKPFARSLCILNVLKSHLSFPCAGGDVAPVCERRQVAPCVCDLVNTGWTMGGLPGRSAERLRD